MTSEVELLMVEGWLQQQARDLKHPQLMFEAGLPPFRDQVWPDA
jgi:hypothetical protein